MGTNKDNGFSKNWEWKEEDTFIPKKSTVRMATSRFTEARKACIKYFNVDPNIRNVELAELVRLKTKWKSKRSKKANKNAIQKFASFIINGRDFKKRPANEFYRSRKWRELRYKALLRCGRACMCCGAQPKDGIILHVDHVKPRSKYPQLELDINNLQILCEDCNLGKSNIFEDDFR